MISVEQAQQTILEQVTPLDSVDVDLLDAVGRVVSRTLISDIDVSPFANSAMDGFGFTAADTEGASPEEPAKLEIVGHIAAGDFFNETVMPGQAVRIMTGAATPEGIDTVEMIEKVTFTGNGLVGDTLLVDHTQPVDKNIRHAGEDVCAGGNVLERGTLVSPAALGLLASTGNATVPVYRTPTVGVLSLGSELVDASVVPGPGKIRNSNTPALAGCIRRAGCEPKLYPIVPDDEQSIRSMLWKACEECDFVVSSGGASEGDYDFITQCADALGTVFFKYVNMRPGKSQTFATIEGTPFIGLAGNPAAAVVGFEMLAFPALMKMQGRSDLTRPVQTVRLATDVHKKGTRRQYQRATLTKAADGVIEVTPDKKQSSALFGVLQRADCLLIIPGDTNDVAAGTMVDCIRLDLDPATVI